MYITRLIKDVLFYLTLPLPFLFIPFVINKELGTRYIMACTIFIGMSILPVFLVASYWLLFNVRPSVDTAVAMLQTNLQESLEFIYSYISIKQALILLMSVLSLFVILFNLLKGIICNIDFSNYKYKTRKKIYFGIIIVLSIASLMLFTKTYVAITIQRGFVMYNNLLLFDKNKNFREISLIETCNSVNSGDGNFVLIIGETHTRSHMSAFGYNRKTTPWLEQIVSDGNILLPGKTYSCAAQTQQVLELALTEKSQYNNIPLHNAMTIVEMAHHAGFDVIWITNHTNDTIAGLIAGEADQTYWLNESKNDTFLRQQTKYIDSIVVDKCKELVKSNKKTLYVIHLTGSHAAYRFRYPEKFNVWNDEIEVGYLS